MSDEHSGECEAFDQARTFVHLGRGSTATPLPDFDWSAEHLEAYRSRFAADGREGRLVCVIAQAATWDGWERHPAGEEVVVLLSGRVDVVQGPGSTNQEWRSSLPPATARSIALSPELNGDVVSVSGPAPGRGGPAVDTRRRRERRRPRG